MLVTLQQSVVFFYASNEKMDFEVENTIQLMIEPPK